MHYKNRVEFERVLKKYTHVNVPLLKKSHVRRVKSTCPKNLNESIKELLI